MTESHGNASADSLVTQQLNTAQLSPDTVLAGRFTIRKQLGTGAQAVVYHAFDELLQVDVALKLVDHLLPHSDDLQTIRQEVVIARRLNHPNIIRVHDLFVDEHHIFFTMAYVEGEALYHRLQQPVSKSEYRQWASQLLDAVHTCQHADVLHGDIKPDNILIDNDGKLVLIDFGIGQLGELATQTSGHPQYSAPEVLHGGHASTVADTYSIGRVLQEILNCVSIPTFSLADRLWKRKQHQFLKTLTHRLPAKRPEVETALAHFALSDQRKMSALAWLLTITVLLTVTVYLGFRYLNVSKVSLPQGQLNLIVQSQQNIPLLTTLNKLLSFSLSQHPDVKVFDEQSTQPLVTNLSLDPISRASDRIALATPLDADLVVTLTAVPTGNETFLLDSTGYMMPANRQLFSVNASLHAHSLKSDLAAFSKQILEAIVVHTNNPMPAPDTEFISSLSALEHAQNLSQKDLISAMQKNAPGSPEGWLAGAQLAMQEGQIGDANRQLDKLLETAGSQEYWLLQANYLKAQISDDLKLAQQSIDRLTTLYPNNAKLLAMRAQTHLWADNIKAALADYKQALKITPNDAQLWFELARQQIINGDIKKAIDKALTQSLILYRQQENVAGESLILNAFGVAHLRLANYQIAQRYFSDSLALRTANDFPSERATTLANLANVAAIGGDYPLAEKSLSEALQLLDELGDRVQQAHVLDTLGFLFEEQGNYREALGYYKHGLDIRVQLKEESKQAESMSNVAYMHFLMGDFSLADIYWQQAKAHFERNGDQTHLLRTIQNLAQLSLAKGDKLAAARSLAGVEGELNPQQVQERMYNQLLFSYLNFSEGKLDSALKNSEQAEQLASDMGDTRALTEVMLWQGEVCVYIADWQCVQDLLNELTELVNDGMKEQHAVVSWLQLVIDIESAPSTQRADTSFTLPFEQGTIPVLTELKILLDLQHRMQLPATSALMQRINKLIKPAFYQAHMHWLYLKNDEDGLKQQIETHPGYWRNHIFYQIVDESKAQQLTEEWLSKLNENQTQQYQRTYLERL